MTGAATGLPKLIAELRQRAAASAENAASRDVPRLRASEAGAGASKLRAEVAELERMAPCVYLALNRHDEHRIVSRDEGCTVMRWKLYQQGARHFGPRMSGCLDDWRDLESAPVTDLDHFMARIESQDYPITSWNELLAWREPADGVGGSPTS